jgi:thiopeptide-type bacteriocin biosynthesis protein
MSSPRRDRCLLEPVGWGIVRAPLLPVEHYPRPSRDGLEGLPLLPDRPDVRAALAVGSHHLYDALERTDASAPDAPRLRRKLLRYLIRMTTRPTPYGLFAGVGMVEWGPVTDVALAPRPPKTRTRPDMGWLLGLVAELEHDPAVRRRLGLFANPLALSRGGRVFLCEAADGAKPGAAVHRVSIRATAAVQRVLARARMPASHDELAAELRSMPGATEAKIDKLIDDLWQQAFLLTDLRPPLTGMNPGRYVCDRLSAARAAGEVEQQLSELLDALAEWNSLAFNERAAGWRPLTERASALHRPAGASVAPQVDMALALHGTRVHRNVAKEAARAAELLLRLTPHPEGPPRLAAYRERFFERYGPEREVALLELLDPEFGLGVPDEDPAPTAEKRATDAERGRILADLAMNALRKRQLVIELDDALVSRLATWSPAPRAAPRSLEINVLVATTSPAAIDAGDFTLVVGPNVGADSAGRGLGRFADLLGAEATTALQALVREEDPDATRLTAELTYLPQRARAANVAVRPTVGGHEIPCGTIAAVPADRVVPLDELMVGVRGGRFYVGWPAANATVAISARHMLNPLAAPPPVRFLHDVERDGRAVFDGFRWGSAGELAFLPRVQRGRVVLAPARWRVDGSDELATASGDFHRALADWRERWLVPRYVYLTEADQRLLLDLDDRGHAELLREELRREPAGRGRILQEALPGPQDAWLPGPDGRRIAELVVPLTVRAGAPHGRTVAASPSATSPVTPSVRLRPPGSDWLYVKLYCPPTLHDDLIAEELAPFADFVTAAQLAERWFFIRYADTGPHLRVRFRGQPDVLTSRLLPQVCTWATSLMAGDSCLSFAFDTYEREVERYGGAAGITLAEELFAADSRAVARILRVASEPRAPDRTALAVLSVDALLDALGMDANARIAWYGVRAPLSRDDGLEYRRRREQLCELLAHGATTEGMEMLAHALETRRHALQPLRSQLDDLTQQRQIRVPKTALCASYVHMHCNRLLAADTATEKNVFRLATRALLSLSRAPVAYRRSASGIDGRHSE